MGYIGATPSNAFINNDVQRVTNSTNNYVDLDHNISSLDSVIVFVNNVRQESTNLTFTSASRIGLGDTLQNSDVVEIVFIGKAVSTQSPGTGTVTNDMLAGSIANSKLATDPLNASNLASGTVPTARLGSGTASSSTVLFGDQTFKTAPTGNWTLLETETITGSTPSTVDISNFDSSYNIHAIAFDSVGSSSDNDTFRQAFSSDNGSNFNVQGYGAGFGHRVNQSNTVTTDNFGTSGAGFLKLAEGVGGDSDEGLSGLIYYTGLKDTARQTYYWGNTMIENDSSNYINYVILGKLTTVDIDAIRFNFNSGTFDMGIIKLFGIK